MNNNSLDPYFVHVSYSNEDTMSFIAHGSGRFGQSQITSLNCRMEEENRTEQNLNPENRTELEPRELEASRPEEAGVHRKRHCSLPIETEILMKRAEMYHGGPKCDHAAILKATVEQLNALDLRDGERSPWSNTRVRKWFNNNKRLLLPTPQRRFHGRDRFRFRSRSVLSTAWGQSTAPAFRATVDIDSRNESPSPDVVQPGPVAPPSDVQAAPMAATNEVHADPMPPTGYMFLEVLPWDGRNSRRTLARVGLKNDRLDVRSFMINCPDDWFALFGNSEIPGWDHSLRIFTSRDDFNTKHNPTFTIYFGANFTEQVICCSYDAHAKCRQKYAAFDGSLTLFLFPTRSDAASYICPFVNHPFNVFSRSLLDGRRNAPADASVIQGLNQDIIHNINKRLLRDQAAGDLLQAIAALSLHGKDAAHLMRSMVTITASMAPSLKMVKLPDGRGVFRIVWVFTHAVDMLAGLPRPACVLLDGTFSILHPVCFFTNSSMFSNCFTLLLRMNQLQSGSVSPPQNRDHRILTCTRELSRN
jgi:hypothetical protein